VSPALALAFVPLLLTLLLRYRHHVLLLFRAVLLRWLRDLLSGLTREQRACQYVLSHSVPGDPQHVLLTFDRWSYHCEHLSSLGPVKGEAGGCLARPRHPRHGRGAVGMVMVPLVQPQDQWHGHRTIGMATGPGWGRGQGVAGRGPIPIPTHPLLQVQLLVGPWSEVIPQLCSRQRLAQADLVLMAHWKRRYVRDLRLLEHLRLLAPGATVLADHVLFPGAPRFLQYARACGRFQTRLHRASLEYCPGIPDGLAELRYIGSE
ncbi:TOMT methyltransferase, partial [Urocolius indicus]|nr:TOMT methyltransferase [Urocolius indicus]